MQKTKMERKLLAKNTDEQQNRAVVSFQQNKLHRKRRQRTKPQEVGK